MSIFAALGLLVVREHDFANAVETLESYKTAKSVIVSDINGKQIFKDGRGYEPIDINEIPIDAINLAKGGDFC